MLNMLLYFTFLLIKASLHGPQNVIHVYIFIKEAISVGGELWKNTHILVDGSIYPLWTSNDLFFFFIILYIMMSYKNH